MSAIDSMTRRLADALGLDVGEGDAPPTFDDLLAVAVERHGALALYERFVEVLDVVASEVFGAAHWESVAEDVRARVDAELFPNPLAGPICEHCERAPAACVGRYEGSESDSYACAGCCDSPNSEHGCTPMEPRS